MDKDKNARMREIAQNCEDACEELKQTLLKCAEELKKLMDKQEKEND